MRIDQLQTLLANRAIASQVGLALGYRHLAWIMKDTDSMVAHFPKYGLLWDVPDNVNVFPVWVDSIADAIKLMPSYITYNESLGVDAEGNAYQGIFIMRDFRILESDTAPSGWALRYGISFVDPRQPLM